MQFNCFRSSLTHCIQMHADCLNNVVTLTTTTTTLHVNRAPCLRFLPYLTCTLCYNVSNFQTKYFYPHPNIRSHEIAICFFLRKCNRILKDERFYMQKLFSVSSNFASVFDRCYTHTETSPTLWNWLQCIYLYF